MARIELLNPLPSEPSPPPERGLATWRANECPFRVDYPAALFETIRERAVEAFHSLPHGGREIGGILFGRVSPNARTPLTVELVAERPISCGHAFGPVFVLTEEEKSQAAALLARSRLDPDLSAFSVAGFWVSHSRSDLALTPDNLDLYRTTFPHPWQIALVLKPESGAPTRAAIFFRSGGEVAPHQARHSFLLHSGGAVEPAAAAEPEPVQPFELQPEVMPSEFPAESTGELDSLASVADGAKSIPRRTVGMPMLALFLLLAALFGAGLTYWLLTRVAGFHQFPT